jgi:hypothetical protein
MDIINKLLEEKDFSESVKECEKNNFSNLAKIIAELNNIELKIPEKIKINLTCNWCTPQELTDIWNKMSKGNYTWDNIQLTTAEDPDYYVVINKPSFPLTAEMKKKTILFRMEPKMSEDIQQWGEYADPIDSDFLRVFRHEKRDYNNNEWHLSKTYDQLSKEIIVKNPEYDNVLSTVLSGKYQDPGHIARVDFIKYIESKGVEVHVYGTNRWDYKNYKGTLPYHKKDDAIFPYKYSFNAENNSIANYYTEKLIDGILGECLVFYSGCYNVREYIDPRAYVYLELSNFEEDYKTIQKAIKEDWHTQRLPYIREAKRKILNELQFFPRISSFLNDLRK